MEQLEVIEPTPSKKPSRAVATKAQGAVAVTTPYDLLRIAVESNADMDKLERLMALQERYEANEARKAFNEAMADFKAEAVEVIKRKLVDFATSKGRTTYYHAELSDVIEAVGPALSKHGLSFAWSTKQDRTWIEVTCTLKHRMGHSESVTLGAAADESGGKNSIQAIISTTTYLERHTLKAITGVAEKGQDDDGQAGGQQQQAEECPPELLQEARDKSLEGWKAFAAWIKGRSEKERVQLDPYSDELKRAAAAADKTAKQPAAEGASDAAG